MAPGLRPANTHVITATFAGQDCGACAQPTRVPQCTRSRSSSKRMLATGTTLHPAFRATDTGMTMDTATWSPARSNRSALATRDTPGDGAPHCRASAAARASWSLSCPAKTEVPDLSRLARIFTAIEAAVASAMLGCPQVTCLSQTRTACTCITSSSDNPPHPTSIPAANCIINRSANWDATWQLPVAPPRTPVTAQGWALQLPAAPPPVAWKIRAMAAETSGGCGLSDSCSSLAASSSSAAGRWHLG
mmetsp:Transcript_69728/g.160239  ORF Transcript_69728/g.160239 Transcript_69728/m.160239 type:complete len:248 (+) Transcript_69728:156-899(+)